MASGFGRRVRRIRPFKMAGTIHIHCSTVVIPQKKKKEEVETCHLQGG